MTWKYNLVHYASIFQLLSNLMSERRIDLQQDISLGVSNVQGCMHVFSRWYILSVSATHMLYRVNWTASMIVNTRNINNMPKNVKSCIWNQNAWKH